MKSLISIFLLVIVFTQTFSTYMLDADYWLNKDYVASNLCVNKSKPQMHCNGKCYLAKQVAKDNEQQQKAPVSKKERTEIQPYFLSRYTYLQPVTSTCKRTYINGKENIQLPLFYQSVFHPPAV